MTDQDVSIIDAKDPVSMTSARSAKWTDNRDNKVRLERWNVSPSSHKEHATLWCFGPDPSFALHLAFFFFFETPDILHKGKQGMNTRL